MEILIDKAEISDLELLLQWRMTVLQEVFPSPPYVFPADLEEANRNYYQWAIPAGEHIACFARAGREIIGCGGLCLYQEMPSPDNPSGKCAYLMNIYSLPSCRRQGVGEAIVRWLTDRAKEQCITKIYLESTDIGRPLYEKIGFSTMHNMLILPQPVCGSG